MKSSDRTLRTAAADGRRSRLAWRVALALALSMSACVSPTAGDSGNGGSNGGVGGGNGQAGSSGGTGGTTGGGVGGSTTATGGRTGTGTGGTAVTGGGGRGQGGSGVGGSPGVGGSVPNPDAGARPDLSGRKALFIVAAPGSLDDGEILFEQLLGLRGMTVTYGSLTTPASMATGFNLVVISSGLGSDTAVSAFKDVPVPMIVFYRDALLPLGFIAASAGRGSSSDTVTVTITDTSTPLSSDFSSGTMFLMTSAALHSSQYGWGIPGGTPIKVAAVTGAATELAVFAYEKGAAMAVGTAAARRVVLGWKINVIDALTVQGFKLQDAAVSWTAGAP